MLSVALLLLLGAGSSVKSQQLTQPASATVQPGQTLTISCQVSYSMSYWTHWIRQPAGKGLEWIGYTCSACTPVYKDSLKNKFSFTVVSSSNSITLNGQNLQPQDSAVYYCARGRYTWVGAFDYWGDGTTVTVLPVDSPQTPSLFVLSPLSTPDFPLKSADDLGPNVCLVTNFRPKGGDVVLNGKGGPDNVNTDKAVLSKNNTYNFAAFSNETIYSCGMNGIFANNEADDECGSIYPEKAKLNFYLLLMNGVRVVFTKALAFSTVLTIRGLLF